MMEKFFRLVDGVSDVVGRWASFLVVILVISIGYDIFMRYLFASPTFWAYDMTIMLFGTYSMLGAAYCHYREGHVRMDLIYGTLSSRRRATIDVICYIFLFFPLFTVLLYKCGEHAVWSLIQGERSSSSVWRPPLAPFKLTIAFGLLLFLLQGIVQFLRSLMIVLKGGERES
jgi:TRAP-type mannitol/chloroaromatic compound transport system permease small subunit